MEVPSSPFPPAFWWILISLGGRKTTSSYAKSVMVLPEKQYIGGEIYIEREIYIWREIYRVGNIYI